MIYSPNSSKGIEVYVDADFAGGWDPTQAEDADNVYLHTGFVIYYARCHVYWQSKFLTEIAVSTAEAEYIAMSAALRETIPLATLIREMNEILHYTYPLQNSSSKFLRTINLALQWLKILNLLCGPNTLQLNTITFGSMSSLKQIQMGSFSLSTVLQMIRSMIYLLNLTEMTFSTSSGCICWDGD
jgi:hypothetical protein